MSELNERISTWRVSLGQRLGAEPAAELEDHLRTTIDSLAATGLPDDERLLLAAHRLGHPDALSAEFAKNDPFAVWRGRLAWMLIGLVPMHLLLDAIQGLANRAGSASINWGWAPWAPALAIFGSQVLIWGAILGSCVWAGKATRPLRWTPAGWLPTSLSFLRLSGMLAILVAILFVGPHMISMHWGSWGAVDAAHSREFHDFIRIYSIVWSWLHLASYIVAAVLIAWLIVPRRVETDAV